MGTAVAAGPMRSLIRWLDNQGVDYEVHEHPRALTALATARAEGVDPRTFAKAVWVRTAEGASALLVVDAEDHVDMRKARELMHSHKVVLVDEEELNELAPECDPGAMPAVGALFGVPTYADVAIRGAAEISFNAGTHAHAVRVDRAAWDEALGVVYGELAADAWHERPPYRP